MNSAYGVPGGARGINKECIEEWQALQRAKYLRAKRAGARISPSMSANLAKSIPPDEWMRRCRARKVGPLTTSGGSGVSFGDASGGLSNAGLAGGFAVFGALLLLMPFVIVPLLIKPFAPKWSYGKRVALGLLVSLSIGAIRGIVRAGRKK